MMRSLLLIVALVCVCGCDQTEPQADEAWGTVIAVGKSGNYEIRGNAFSLNSIGSATATGPLGIKCGDRVYVERQTVSKWKIVDVASPPCEKDQDEPDDRGRFH